ncbi:MAG: lysophospholipid acyltransferase family protein [Paracoccaceae bacterium]
MVDSYQDTPLPDEALAAQYVPYDKRKLSYANTFPNPWKATTIRTMEWLTGKFWLLRLIRRFEAEGIAEGQAFWPQALRHMGIAVQTPNDEVTRIPAKGPVIIVANHPHGLVDGMVLAEMIGRVRQDYKILTRSLLTEVEEVKSFMIPVPFPHEEGAIEKSLEMRKRAMAHLENDGAIVIFPSGVVASSDTMFGGVVEREWNPFTGKMILRSNAMVVPIYFPGRNSRLYQIANQISATMRQGLLIHEVVGALNKPQRPIIGNPIDRDAIGQWKDNPRGFVGWLREETLKLKP